MKKLLAVVICLALLSAMSGVIGCDGGKKTTPTPTGTPTPTPTATTPAKTT